MRVLVADDDRTSRTLLAAMVSRWGHDAVVAADGAAAWEALQHPDPPRLVLLDWNMPVLDGLDVCRRLRASGSPNPPYVILLTARSEKGDIVRGLEAGANDYVAKPYDHEELQARLLVGQRTLALQAHLLAVQEALAEQATHDASDGYPQPARHPGHGWRRNCSGRTRQDDALSVGMCDVDHFKAVNDTYGHQAGDDVLRGFTASVQAQLRRYDSVGRYGGEEFLVIAPGVRERRRRRALRTRCAIGSRAPPCPPPGARSRSPSASGSPPRAAEPQWTRCSRPPTPRSIEPRRTAGTGWRHESARPVAAVL